MSPTGLRLLTLEGNAARSHHKHDSAGVLLPSWDGLTVYTAEGIYTLEFKPVAPRRAVQAAVLHPGPRPRLFPDAGAVRRAWLVHGYGENAACLRLQAANRQLLITLNDLHELVGRPIHYNVKGLTLEKCLHLIPDANLLLTLNAASDELILPALT